MIHAFKALRAGSPFVGIGIGIGIRSIPIGIGIGISEKYSQQNFWKKFVMEDIMLPQKHNSVY